VATPRLITEQEFRTSRYAQVADQIEGRISDVIAQAEDYIESFLDRRLTVNTYTEMYRPTGKTLFLRERPIQEVIAVRKRANYQQEWQSLSLDTFEVRSAQGFITSLADNIKEFEVQVEYEAGYSSIPDDIKGAVILQTVVLAYQDLEVYGAGDSKAPGILYLSDQVKYMLKPYRYSRTVVGQ
jgi:hypothetical protein